MVFRFKDRERKQILSNDLAEIIAYAYNSENTDNDNFQGIDRTDAAYFRLDTDNTIKFSIYTRFRIEDFIKTKTDKNTGKLKIDIKNELWMLVMLLNAILLVLTDRTK